MVKFLSADDFRARRRVLERKDFALASRSERRPSDLISEDVWKSIITLPDDVSIRTTNHYGRIFGLLDDGWGAWIEALSEGDELSYVMLNAADEFQAATLNALQGYYRVSFGCLRTVLELLSIGLYCQVCGKSKEFKRWLKGREEIKFGMACSGLSAAPALARFSGHLRTTMKDSFFDQKDSSKKYPGGWVIRLHSMLSDYIHSSPRHSSAALWGFSNGPIYEPSSVVSVARHWVETMATGYILVKAGRPQFRLPEKGEALFTETGIPLRRIIRRSYKFYFTP